MAADIAAIRLALRDNLITNVPSLPPLQEWENRTFVPPSPEGDDWVREFNSVVAERLAGSNTTETVGNYRILLVYPLGQGTEDIESVSTEIVAAFKPGLGLPVSPGCTVQIFRTERLAPSTSAVQSWYTITTVISWRVYSSLLG
jgi:hypothetical protein